MISFKGKKIKNIPKTDKKIIEVWFRGYMIYPEPSEIVPDVIRKIFQSCFALGRWYNTYFWTDDLIWANDVYEAVENYNEQYGTEYTVEHTGS